MPLRSILVLLLLALTLPVPARAQLRGHGGPVRALAISADGATALSGSFDQSAILWSLDDGAAIAVLRFHEGAVNAVAMLPGRRFATAGEDGAIALWTMGREAPDEVIAAHRGPIAALAVAADGHALASASWDGTARVTPLDGGPARLLDGHAGNVNAVGFLPDGGAVTAGYDGTLRLWPPDGAGTVARFATPLNVVAMAGGDIVTAGADGIVRILTPAGALRAEVPTQPSPVIALAVSPDGWRIAAATIGGTVAIIDRAAAKVLFNLPGPGLPVWSLAFRPDGRELLSGGGDRVIRRWNARTGEHIGPVVIAPEADLAATSGHDRGAEVFRACVACHTLTPGDGNRAGPTLSGVLGRRVATAPGYNFSAPLRRLDLVWTAETIAKLFEVGPAHYLPGTKMPDQIIANAADREALVRYLETTTRVR